MPLAGTGLVMATARIAAEDTVKAAWKATADSLGRPLTPAELAQMRLDMKTADSNAIILHLIASLANSVVPSIAAVGFPASII